MESALAVSVVLPTYKEAESLPDIVPRIGRAMQAAQIPFEIIVVDDNSPDGTAEVAQQLSQSWPVRVHKRQHERGLATAVLAGFAMSQAPVVVVMDADGSHPVEALAAMTRMILQDKADIVVGSRHVPGGGSKDWPVFSQLKSKLAAALAFGVTSMTDPTTGFMALRRTLLSGLSLDPVGWKIVLEIVVKAAPVRVAEVPIIFTDRTLGMSKQSIGVFIEYLAHLGKLYAHRYPSLAELIKFCVVGVLGLVVDMATVIAFKERFGLDTRLCAVLGFSVAVTTNFALNRRYTFKRAAELPWLFSYATYVGTNLFGLALRMLAIQAFIVVWGIDQGRGYLLTNLIGIVLATLLNFIGAKFFAFDPERLAPPSPAERDQRRSPSSPAAASRLALPLFFVGCAAYSLATTLWHAGPQLPDEGVNITMAQNIRQSLQLLVRPSVFVGGRADWLREDLPELGNLPFYPWLLSLTPKLLGFSGMALVSLLALWVTIFSTARLVALVDARAAIYTALLMASSPAWLLAFRRIEFEPVLTAFCSAGLYAFVRGTWNRQRLLCMLGGVLLGLGFLTKMWLILPSAFALFAFCVVEAAQVRQTGESAGLRRSFAWGVFGFLLAASAHLAFIALASPSDLPQWLSSVYFGIFSGEGVTGGKLSGVGHYADHQRSAFYYPLVLYRDHFYLLPLSLFGVTELLRQRGARLTRLLAMIAAGCVALVALSVPAYKEARYVLCATPLLYVLAGLSLACLSQAQDKFRPANIGIVRTVMVLSLLSPLLLLLIHFTHWAGVSISLRYVLGHCFAMLLCVALGIFWQRRARLVPALSWLCAIGLCSFAVADATNTSPTPYPALAALMAPHLAGAQAAYPSFIATDHAVLQAYLQHVGVAADALTPTATERWQRDTKLRVAVIAPANATAPASDEFLHWLSAHALELDAKASAPGYRVFAR